MGSKLRMRHQLVLFVVLCFACARIHGQSCTDGVKNGQETDKDCGGPTCPQCLTAKACLSNRDCTSASCTSGKCAEPSQCYNKVKDRRETDVDCGGGECFAACWIGKGCGAVWDCKSKVCTGGVCTEASTCKNGILDGVETDVDCGGGGCLAYCQKYQKCTDARDCITGVCWQGKCGQPSYCSNGVKDGTESDVDCGGLCDADCAVTQLCKANSDCVSNVCTGGKCANAPTCSNGKKDGAETDVDCGGAGCAANCAKGQGCLIPTDCSTVTCSGGVCVQPATCTNKVKDSNEGDVDCGGPCDKQCGVGATCSGNTDCISSTCSSGRCVDARTCSNGIKDAKETDVDCGGGGCGTACDVSQSCASTSDCKTKICTNKICQQLPTCTNGVWDSSTEGDKDCGQLCNKQCGVGAKCRIGADCVSNTCTGGKCTDASTCSNGKMDALETDVDCGGGGCGASCLPGQGCVSTWDCNTKLCSNGACQQLATCSNGVLDANEGGVDCGQFCNIQCGAGKTCKANADCVSGVCGSDGSCKDAPTCSNGKKDGAETDVDCGGGGCTAACAPGKSCATGSDCQTGQCVNGACAAQPLPTCKDGIRNGQESDIDCGGPVCPPCMGQRLCWANSDCASQTCNF